MYPSAQQPHLLGREGNSFAGGGHFGIRHQPRHVMNEGTPGAVAGKDVHTVVATQECPFPRVEAQAVFGPVRPVAFLTGGLEQRLDISSIIDAGAGRRRQFGGIQFRNRGGHGRLAGHGEDDDYPMRDSR